MHETITGSDVRAAEIYWRFRKELYNLYKATNILNIYQLEIDTIEKVDSYIDAKIENSSSIKDVENLKSVKRKIDEQYKKRNRFYIPKQAASGK